MNTEEREVVRSEPEAGRPDVLSVRPADDEMEKNVGGNEANHHDDGSVASRHLNSH